MAKKLIDPKFEQSITHKFRLKRFAFFREKYHQVQQRENRTIKILDIGGTEIYWERMGFPQASDNVHITLLNLWEVPVKNTTIFSSVKGDATSMPQYADGEFDIVFSNSCIEHLFTWENQQKMAREIRRVGKAYYVQTPNYWFPIEPHWVFPFFQYLPVSLRVFLTHKIGFGHVGRQRDKATAISRVKEVRLLTQSEMKTLFPDGQVYKERLFGMKKSVALYKF